MGKKIGVKRTYTIPKKIDAKVKEEAEKRLPLWKIGKKQKGSIERDIICIAINIGLPEIKKMNKNLESR